MSFLHDTGEVEPSVAVDPKTEPLAICVADVSVGLVVVDILAPRAVRADAFFECAADLAFVVKVDLGLVPEFLVAVRVTTLE